MAGEIIFIPSHSLSFLPDYYQYKMLYIQGEGDFKTKTRNGKLLPEVLSTKKWANFEQERNKIETWIESQASLSLLYLTYDELLENKEEQSLIIQNFLKD